MNKLVLCAIACALLAGCASPAAPAAPELAPPVQTAQPTPAPEPKWLRFEGEWAGALGSGVGQAREYMALLTLSGGEAFLALDKLEPFGSGFGPSVGSCGIKLTVLDATDAALTLSVEEYAYNSLQEPLLEQSSALLLELDSGALRCEDFGAMSASFARLGGPEQGAPRWMKQFTDALPGVRGVYEFGKSITGEKTYVFAYEGNDGFPRIRTGYGAITHIEEQGGKKAFISTYEMDDLVCDGEEAPYWDSAIMLDAETGDFVDVTDQFTDYYKNAIIPRYEEALLLAMDARDAAPKGDERNYLEKLVAVYEEALFRAHEAAYGERPDELIIDVPDTRLEAK